jgi:hypothetical protein
MPEPTDSIEARAPSAENATALRRLGSHLTTSLWAAVGDVTRTQIEGLDEHELNAKLREAIQKRFGRKHRSLVAINMITKTASGKSKHAARPIAHTGVEWKPQSAGVAKEALRLLAEGECVTEAPEKKRGCETPLKVFSKHLGARLVKQGVGQQRKVLEHLLPGVLNEVFREVQRVEGGGVVHANGALDTPWKTVAGRGSGLAFDKQGGTRVREAAKRVLARL